MRVLDYLKQFGSQSVARTRFHGRRPGLVYVLGAALFDDLSPQQVEWRNGWRDPNQPLRIASEINLLGYRDRVVHRDSAIPDGALQFRMTQEQLHGAQVAGFPIHQRGLGPSERVRAINGRVQIDRRDSVLDDAGVLPGGKMRRAPCGSS
jgi:hypothetical protein